VASLTKDIHNAPGQVQNFKAPSNGKPPANKLRTAFGRSPGKTRTTKANVGHRAADDHLGGFK